MCFYKGPHSKSVGHFINWLDILALILVFDLGSYEFWIRQELKSTTGGLKFMCKWFPICPKLATKI